MAAISSLTDQELDELLAGHTPEGRGELAPLADVAIAVRDRTAVEPAPVMAYTLRQAVARGAAPVAPRPRRLVPVAVGAFALAGITMAGAANALPAPVQDVIAEAGDLVGVDLPHSTDDDVVETDDLSSRTTDTSRPLADGVGSDAEPKNQSVPTPGGATPADPGTAGDRAPATPAIPPDHSTGGNDVGTGQGTGNRPTGTEADDDEGDDHESDDDEGDDEATDNGTGQGNADGTGDGQGSGSRNGKATDGPTAPAPSTPAASPTARQPSSS